MNATLEKIKHLDPCREAAKWIKENEQLTTQELWDACERGDWMLWLIARLRQDEETKKLLVLAACKCARQALKYIPKDEKRPLNAIKTAEKWAKGKATIEEVKAASDAAYDAAAAAYAAAYAAYAAAAAAYAAHAAAAVADADAAAKSKSQKKSANIVRSFFPNSPIN